MLQFGHAQRAWDDAVDPSSICDDPELQFGHAQRAWDDPRRTRARIPVARSFNSATPRGRGMTLDAVQSGTPPREALLQFGHAQRAWDDNLPGVAGTPAREGFNSATPRGRGMTWRTKSRPGRQGVASIRPRPEGVG